MRKLTILTINVAIQDVSIFGRSLYCPVAYPAERLRCLPGELLAINADIICLQELFHLGLQEQLYRSVSHVYPHAAGFARRGNGLRFDSELLVLSKFPLHGGRLHRFEVATPEELSFTSKGFYDIQVRIPGLGDVEVLNFHATAGGIQAHPESVAMERIRARQVRQLLSHVNNHDRSILVGDLNAGPHSSVRVYELVLEAGFTDAFARAGGDGISWDPDNPLVAMGRESHLPPQRIDHIFLSRSLADRLEPTTGRIVFNHHCTQTVAGLTPLSDHYGVLTVIEYEE